MAQTRTPSKFFKALAAGAPAPFVEKPVRIERMIHFVAPQIEKIRAKIPELIKQVDVICGNLEDAIPAQDKEAARRGFIELARANDFGSTGLWTRINALNSPWVLDDIVELVAEVGNKLDVMMMPKVEGPWDIHYLDQLLAQLEAKHNIKKPIMIHALLETAEGVSNVSEIAGASPRMHGMSLGPADLAASRAMKTTRVRRRASFLWRAGRREARRRFATLLLSTGFVALYRRGHGGCLRNPRHQAFLRAVRRLLRCGGLRIAVPECLSSRLRGGVDAASLAD